MELKMNKIRVALVTMSLFTMLIGSSTINLSVNFVNYESGPDAYMYMGYVWSGASWEDAFAAGEVQNKMFGVFPPGTANGTYDVTFTDLAEGNYYAGVFETTYMGYVPDDPALLLVGWYDPAEDGNNSQTEPAQITVTADTDMVLETMAAPAPALGINGEPHFNAENYTLLSSYPNPFNPSTRIDYVVPVEGMITLFVFNISGQKMSSLVDGYKQTGGYSLNWDGTNYAGESLPAGIYFIRIEYAGGIMTQKITLLK